MAALGFQVELGQAYASHGQSKIKLGIKKSPAELLAPTFCSLNIPSQFFEQMQAVFDPFPYIPSESCVCAHSSICSS